MDIPVPIISAIIAALVSVAAGFLTYIATKRSLEHQREMQEREMRRRFTERLYELRLEAYPRAFEITDKLRGGYLFGPDLKEEQLAQLLEELHEWHRSKAAFVLSTDAIRAWYGMRGCLGLKPEQDGHYTEDQRKKIWDAKNNFRKTLRDDVDLLYEEETIPNEDT